MPKVDHQGPDIHEQNTLILENGPRRMAPPSRGRAATKPPPLPRGTGRGQQGVKPIYNDEDVHSQPTMIIDIGRVRGRR
jgi:hypothetical protein